MNRTEGAAATLGGGCFWCLEAVFKRIDGVGEVVCGYAGGTKEDPSYEEVCSGSTGHAEVVRLAFDPQRIDFAGILKVFWKAHDPTSLNRQGADVGTQYRSIILTHDETQKREAEESVDEMNRSGAFPRPIVTEVKPLEAFYPAEDYHRDYFERNPEAAYCSFVIRPKLRKLGLEKKHG